MAVLPRVMVVGRPRRDRSRSGKPLIASTAALDKHLSNSPTIATFHSYKQGRRAESACGRLDPPAQHPRPLPHRDPPQDEGDKDRGRRGEHQPHEAVGRSCLPNRHPPLLPLERDEAYGHIRHKPAVRLAHGCHNIGSPVRGKRRDVPAPWAFPRRTGSMRTYQAEIQPIRDGPRAAEQGPERAHHALWHGISRTPTGGYLTAGPRGPCRDARGQPAVEPDPLPCCPQEKAGRQCDHNEAARPRPPHHRGRPPVVVAHSPTRATVSRVTASSSWRNQQQHSSTRSFRSHRRRRVFIHGIGYGGISPVRTRQCLN